MENYDIFMSYISDDSDIALEIQKNLKESDITCYMSSDNGFNDIGQSSQITQAIKKCRAFILILSNRAQDSQWITKELDYAVSMNKTILPFFVEDCALKGDYKFYLSDVQHYRAFIDKTSSMKKLTMDVIRIINQPDKGEEVTDDNTSLKKHKRKIIYMCFGIALICLVSIVLFITSRKSLKENELWKAEEPYSFVWEDNHGTKMVYAVCPVTNTSEGNISLNDSSVSLENKDGDILYDNSVFGNPGIIKPGETGYYNTVLTYEEDNSTEFDIKSNLNIEKYDGNFFLLDTSNVVISDTKEGTIKVTGKIINTTDRTFSDVHVCALLYDENDKLIANPFHNISSQLSSGDQVGFSMQTIYSSPELTSEKVDHFEIYAYSR